MKKVLIAGGLVALLGLGGFAIWKYYPSENPMLGLRYVPVKEEDEERFHSRENNDECVLLSHTELLSDSCDLLVPREAEIFLGTKTPHSS